MADQSNNGCFFPTAIVGLLALYLIPFFAIVMDEVVVGRKFITYAPEWFVEAFQVVYAPLIWIVRQFL